MASPPDLLGLTDATSNETIFPVTSGGTTLWFCCGLDTFIAVIITGLLTEVTIEAKAIDTTTDRARIPSP
jgi:hypothetical protein